MIDGVAQYVVLFAVILLFSQFGTEDEAAVMLLAILSYAIAFLGYYIVMESVWQRTIGKFLFGTKVVAMDGGKPSFGQVVGRSFARYIPFEALSFLASNPQGWHDSLPKTLVVPASYTPEDVRRIDLSKHKNPSTVVVIVICGLIGIMVLGILSAVVLASLSTAREKGQEAKFMELLSSIRMSAEIYYSSNQDSYMYAEDCYSGMFADPYIAQALTGMEADSSTVCYAADQMYVVSAARGATEYCIDNTGYMGEGFAASFEDGSIGCATEEAAI